MHKAEDDTSQKQFAAQQTWITPNGPGEKNKKKKLPTKRKLHGQKVTFDSEKELNDILGAVLRDCWVKMYQMKRS